jgi:predicted nucleic acid-binding protein
LRLFLDTNVILDVLTDRAPFAEDSAAVLSAIERGEAEGFIAAHTATTVFYLMQKELGLKRAKRALMDLLKLVDVVPVDHDRLLQALAMNWDDFEDAVQAACAAKIDADYLITRNQDDLTRADVPTRSPAEYLALHRAKSDDQAS